MTFSQGSRRDELVSAVDKPAIHLRAVEPRIGAIVPIGRFATRWRRTVSNSGTSADAPSLTMLWNVAEPGDAGGFEVDVWVEAAGDGAVNDGLLLLVEQRDHLPLRPDRPPQSPVRPVQEPHNRRLFRGRGNKHRNLSHSGNGQIPLTDSYTIGCLSKVRDVGFAAEKPLPEGVIGDAKVE